MIRINDQLSIPESELIFTYSRAGGPGGQHVNKVATAVTLHFDVAGSESLTDEQRKRIFTKLATRINKQGELYLVARKHRSQAGNEQEAIARFVRLLREALTRRRRRAATRVPSGERRRRLEDKRRRARLKESRRRPPDDD